MESREHAAACFVRVNLDIVAHRIAGPEADHGFGGEAFLGYDASEEALRVVEEFSGFDADNFVF